MILKRYLYGEISKVFAAVICILILIALSNQFVILMTKAAGGKIALGVLLKVLALSLPRLLSYMLPLSLFLSILLALGRLYTDNEMTVLKACGMSLSLRLQIVMVLGIMAMIVVASCSLYIAPKVAAYREQVLQQDESTFLLQTIMPERFHSIKQGELVFYVEKVSSDRKILENVFIAEYPKSNPVKREKNTSDDPLLGGEDTALQWAVLIAKRGKIVNDNGLIYLVLEDGKRYEGLPGRGDYLSIEFEQYGRLLEERIPDESVAAQTPPTLQLLDDLTPLNQAELQWRLAPPISCIVLALMAFALAKSSPRQGRYAKLYPALLLYILYLNLTVLCRRWIQAGHLSPWIGTWWVHLTFGMGAVIGILQGEGIWQLKLPFRRTKQAGSSC